MAALRLFVLLLALCHSSILDESAALHAKCPSYHGPAFVLARDWRRCEIGAEIPGTLSDHADGSAAQSRGCSQYSVSSASRLPGVGW